VGWTGPDLTGRGTTLRGDAGNNGPRVAALQAFLRDRYPLYAKSLAADGWWGPATTAAIAEFGHRSNIPSADGRNIGPKLAAALYAAGFDRTAAQARALAHRARTRP
jgi:peptidoglycan hydrolase-like protein with peptidoglycan-binding domain